METENSKICGPIFHRKHRHTQTDTFFPFSLLFCMKVIRAQEKPLPWCAEIGITPDQAKRLHRKDKNLCVVFGEENCGNIVCKERKIPFGEAKLDEIGDGMSELFVVDKDFDEYKLLGVLGSRLDVDFDEIEPEEKDDSEFYGIPEHLKPVKAMKTLDLDDLTKPAKKAAPIRVEEPVRKKTKVEKPKPIPVEVDMGSLTLVDAQPVPMDILLTRHLLLGDALENQYDFNICLKAFKQHLERYNGLVDYLESQKKTLSGLMGKYAQAQRNGDIEQVQISVLRLTDFYCQHSQQIPVSKSEATDLRENLTLCKQRLDEYINSRRHT